VHGTVVAPCAWEAYGRVRRRDYPKIA